METKTAEAKVEAIIRRYWATANIKEVTIEETITDFLQGELYVVSLFDANHIEHHNYVYSTRGEFYRFDDLKQLVVNVGRDSLAIKMIRNLSSNISGLIAIFITMTLCFLALYRNDYTIIQSLSNALLGILGFYFGSKKTGEKNKI